MNGVALHIVAAPIEILVAHVERVRRSRRGSLLRPPRRAGSSSTVECNTLTSIETTACFSDTICYDGVAHFESY